MFPLHVAVLFASTVPTPSAVSTSSGGTDLTSGAGLSAVLVVLGIILTLIGTLVKTRVDSRRNDADSSEQANAGIFGRAITLANEKQADSDRYKRERDDAWDYIDVLEAAIRVAHKPLPARPAPRPTPPASGGTS